MGEELEVVRASGNEVYERIWDLVRLGAVLSVEFVRADAGRMLATTTVMDEKGITVDRAYIEV